MSKNSLWKESYSSDLFEIISHPKKENIKEIYSLIFTEASNKNYDLILRLINKIRFIFMTFLKYRMTTYMDDFGLTIGTNIYDIILIIDFKGDYYLAVVFNKYIGEFDTELKYIKRVNPFYYKLFRGRRLVYSV